MMRKVYQALVGPLMATSLGIVSAGTVWADDVCPKRGGILKTTDMHYTSVDPAQSVNPHYLMDLVYDALLNVEDDLSLSPGLAEAMPERIDDVTYVFKLREGVKFHDGTDFDADAVKFNVERLQSGDVKSPFSGSWREFVKEVVVEDPHTVRFIMNKPWPAFDWEAATTLRFASPTMVKDLGDNYGVTGAAGTGPFMFDSLDPKKSMTVERNPNYYRAGEPCLDGIEVNQIKSASVRILSVKNGDVDHINTFPESQFPQFEGVDDVIVEEGLATTFTLLPLNTRHPALADKRVRQAIQYAIDGKVIIDNVYGGAGAEVDSIFPPWHKGFIKADNLAPVRPDLDKARALLAEAGYGPDGEQLTLNLMTAPGGAHVQRGILLQAQLKEIGIDLKVENKVYAQILSEMFAGNYHMVLWQFNGGTSLKDFVWNLYATGSGNNITSYNKDGGYQNARAQELIELISRTEDPEEVQDELAEFQSIVFEDVPFVYVNYRNHRSARRDDVKGFNIAKLKGRDDMRRVWLDR